MAIVKTPPLNRALIPTPVMPLDAPRWIQQCATVPKGNESTKVEGENFSFSHLIMQQKKMDHNHTSTQRIKIDKLDHPFIQNE